MQQSHPVSEGEISLRSAERSPPAGLDERLSHNLLGQKLGKKGRDTRERILAATERLLADPAGTPLSLSSVAREASLAMTTLYLYFADLIELLIAVLDPIMASADDGYVAYLRTRWPDDELSENCLTFINEFHAFWERHNRILHLRNSYTADLDRRMVMYRVETSRGLIDDIVRQMDGKAGNSESLSYGIATSLLTGIERLVTVATDAELNHVMLDDPLPYVPNLLRGQAKLLELGIRHCRALSASGQA